MIATERSQSLVELEARLHSLTSQRAALHARAAVLDVGIAEVSALVGEVEERIRAQETALAEARRAAGIVHEWGRRYEEPVRYMLSGGQRTQLSGPRPLDTPKGKADHAHRVLNALEAEAQPVRAALATMESERQEAHRAIGLLGGEIGGVEGQIVRMRQEEAARGELIGRVDWRDRLAAILRRMGSTAGALVL